MVNVKAAKAAAQRILGAAASNLDFRELMDEDCECYQIEDMNGGILIKGTTTSALMSGLGWYLRHIAAGNPAELSSLPPVGKTCRQVSSFRWRYAFNFCTYSYSMAFWDWPQWEKELDKLALQGINLALSLTGQEETLRQTLLALGLTDSQCRAYFTGPAHLAWFWMGNMISFDGPLPEQWFQDRAELGRKIHSRMQELGIMPVLPGFIGMVPQALTEIYPQTVFEQQGKWCGFERPVLLSPDDPMFAKTAEIYYRQQKKLFGDLTPFYAADPFHEGGDYSRYDLAAYGETVWRQMEQAHPGAVWVLQGWGSNPRRQLLERLPQDNVLILNVLAGRQELSVWTDSFYGYPWVWCPAHNYGGRNGMFGFLRTAAREPFDRNRRSAKSLCGIGTAPESLEGSPVFYDLMADLAFGGEPEISVWLKDYLFHRYGKVSAGAQKAWQLLEDSVYNSFLPQPGGAESFFCARPGYQVLSASSWGPKSISYDAEFVRRAAWLLYEEHTQLADSDAYRFDLVDVTRQALSNWARIQYEKLMYRLGQKDAEGFQQAKTEFLEALLAQDRLLATRSEFLLGNRLEEAGQLGRRYGKEQAFKRSLKTLITVWGTREASADLHDYSCREWAGLTRSLYYQRWALFLEQAGRQMEKAAAKTTTAAKDWADDSPKTVSDFQIDWFDLETQWIESDAVYSSCPQGDSVKEAGDILHRFLHDSI